MLTRPLIPALLLALTGAAAAQTTPAGREILLLTPGSFAGGQLPGVVRVLSGGVTGALRNGVQALKAASPTELLISLPELLPQDFTLEFDIIPKQCCNPEDFGVEGTATLSRSSSSAQILWHRNSQSVMGGGPSFQAATPADLQETTPGQLTTIVISVEGETVKLYTNGRRLYTLTERRFARGRVLRVFLGGQDDDDQAVYLARVRVAAGAVTASQVASTGSASTATTTTTNTGATVRAAGTGTIVPVAPAPAPAPITAVTTTTPTTGTIVPIAPAPPPPPPPVVGGGRSPAATSGLRMTLAPRTISLPTFAAVGVAVLSARTLSLPSFTAKGLFATLPPRTISLSDFVAKGVSSLAPRTVTLSAFTAAGVSGTTAPRTIVATVTIPALSFQGSLGGVAISLAYTRVSTGGYYLDINGPARNLERSEVHIQGTPSVPGGTYSVQFDFVNVTAPMQLTFIAGTATAGTCNLASGPGYNAVQTCALEFSHAGGGVLIGIVPTSGTQATLRQVTVTRYQ